MNKYKNGHSNMRGQQMIIVAIALLILVSTGLLGTLLELVFGLVFEAFGLLMGLIGLVIGLFFGVLGLVLGLLPIIVPLLIVIAIVKNVSYNGNKRKNDFV